MAVYCCSDADVEENEPSPKVLKKKQKRVSVKQVETRIWCHVCLMEQFQSPGINTSTVMNRDERERDREREWERERERVGGGERVVEREREWGIEREWGRERESGGERER